APERAISLDGDKRALVTGDPHQLHQVFANLIGNALVHTPPAAPIDVHVSHDETDVTVEVRDHGPGLPAGDPQQLFKRFWRAAAGSCILTPEVAEGPYWVPNHLYRRDVTDGQRGTPLILHLYVENASTCKPIAGADVEIWHASAKGVYSDVQGNTRHFLRGHQK